jgi:hypothetical protein
LLLDVLNGFTIKLLGLKKCITIRVHNFFFQIISDGMSAYLTAAGGYYQPVMTAQHLAGLGAQAGHAGLAAYAAAAPPTVSQAATAGAEARLQ